MEIKNTNDYLKYRAVVLSKEHAELVKRYDNNKIQIAEINKKITEIKSTVDEGFEMFSPKAAEERNFNKQEVNELKIKLVFIAEENKELYSSIGEISNELRVINNLINNSDTTNIEDLNSRGENSIDNEYIEKLQFCSNIAESDPRRVKIELMELINKYK